MSTETTPVTGAESPVVTTQPTIAAENSAPAAVTQESTTQQPAAETQANPGEPSAGNEGKQPENTEDESRRQRRQSADERIKQVVAERNQARHELAAAHRELQRLQQPLQPPGPNASQDEIDRFNMRSAVREQRADEVRAAADQAAEASRNARSATFAAKADAVADRMPGLFQQFCALPKVSEAVADFVTESERGAEVAFFLTQNPNEAARISSMHPYHQGVELARIEARLQAAPVVRKVSTAPPPPPAMPGAPSPSVKAVNDMSVAEMQKHLGLRT